MKRALAALAFAAAALAPRAARAAEFTYDPPGKLAPDSGTGRMDTTVYAPGIRFPIESGPAYANSQVWGHGGMNGPGDQCDQENFTYPWHDNYCEDRDWTMPLCPAGHGHQGQDIRAASCKKDTYPTVAVTDGTITSIGSYSVYLTAADGTRFDYLHMSNVLVKEGDKVKRGQRIGLVSNHFGSSTTTVHLHFNVRQNVDGVGAVYVPPYLSLVNAYEVLLGIAQPATDAGADAAPEPPPAAPQEAPVAAEDPAPAPSADEGGCSVEAGAPPSAWPLAAIAALAFAFVRRRRAR